MTKFEEIQTAGYQIQNRCFKILEAYFPPKYINPMLKHWSSHLKGVFVSFFVGYTCIVLWSFPGNSTLQVELVGKQVKVNSDMAIFITMNPGYAGRSNLPDNLKKLFRSLAMTKPDRQLIAQVMLYSQGFKTAEKLASKIVPFFKWA